MGLDYHEWARVQTHKSLSAFEEAVQPARLLAFSTRGDGLYCDIEYKKNDCLIFGSETRGLPEKIRSANICLKLPMLAHSRSLNLSNCVAVVAYEAWRQCAFEGAIQPD